MSKRSYIDFSKHELTILEDKYTTIHILSLPNSSFHKVVFINTQGVLTVTGDFDNWVFCRDFIPFTGHESCDYYWSQKLKISSTQSPNRYSQTKTLENIENFLCDWEEYGNTMSQEIKDWVEELREASWNEQGYENVAYFNTPDTVDSEWVPEAGYEMCNQFKAVLDAYDEICQRIPIKNT